MVSSLYRKTVLIYLLLFLVFALTIYLGRIEVFFLYVLLTWVFVRKKTSIRMKKEEVTLTYVVFHIFCILLMMSMLYGFALYVH